MKGARPLTDSEIQAVLSALNHGPFKLRNRALFLLGLRTGFRISELLSLRIKDVVENKQLVDRVTVARQHMKKKMEGRTVALHPQAKEALVAWINSGPLFRPEDPLFPSRLGRGALGRIAAWTLLTKAYEQCGLTGQLGTHAMRKTFAKRVHEKLGRDLLKTQKALGHRSVNSTVSYLSFNEEDIDDAILKS